MALGINNIVHSELPLLPDTLQATSYTLPKYVADALSHEVDLYYADTTPYSEIDDVAFSPQANWHTASVHTSVSSRVPQVLIWHTACSSNPHSWIYYSGVN